MGVSFCEFIVIFIIFTRSFLVFAYGLYIILVWEFYILLICWRNGFYYVDLGFVKYGVEGFMFIYYDEVN